ncbi:MBL fold metallo-hydrolase [Bradyrhizobium sp. CCGB01]|uniref:MBL fold metallo-hydrolase n=1 Tax=Bradyrhizobium sp. CCGB01 TaxID=2949634 RepID=UPI0035C7254C
MKKSIFVADAERNETIDLPVSSALIRHKQGNVLFHTGCHPSVVTDAQGRWGQLAKVMRPMMGANQTLVPSLACTGLGSDDVDIVINSHFHPDHCGCNQFFRKATIFAHAKEIEAARAPGADTAGYLKVDLGLRTAHRTRKRRERSVRRRHLGAGSASGPHARDDGRAR